MESASGDTTNQTESAAGQSLTDIQNYLATFNKEIQGDSSVSSGQSFTNQQGAGDDQQIHVEFNQNFDSANFNVQPQPQVLQPAQQIMTPDGTVYYQYTNQATDEAGASFQSFGNFAEGYQASVVSGNQETITYQTPQAIGNATQGTGFQTPRVSVVNAIATQGTAYQVPQVSVVNAKQGIDVAYQAPSTDTVPESSQTFAQTSAIQSVLEAPQQTHQATIEQGQQPVESTSIDTSQIQVQSEVTPIQATAPSSDTQGDALDNGSKAGQISEPQAHIVHTAAPSGGLQKQLVISDAGDSSLKMLADVSGQDLAAVAVTVASNTTETATVSHINSAIPGNSVVLSTGSNQYQTVTIVPSDINSDNDVSYVLIVQQPGDKDSKDPSVYDFKEGDKDDDEHKLKVTPKKAIAPTNSLMCSYCNYTSPKRYLLTRHMKCHSEERPYKCDMCNRGFRTAASLQNHVNVHTGVKPHKCKDCESAFTTSGELVRHIRYKHTFIKPHKCPECDYASVELSKLKRHIRSHTGERPYNCPHCSYASPDTYKLKRHLRIHTGEKPYECDVCHARFTQSNSLKAHKLIHSGNKPSFACELCPTTCGRKTDLKIHIQKLHTSDKPLLCKKCSKSYPDRYSYKLHLKSHDGEKCYKCDFCPYAALSHRHLETHMLVHTGEKPFACSECNMSFRQKSLLKRHMNVVHNPNYVPPEERVKEHSCCECDKMFVHKGNLMKHLTTHGHTLPEGTEIDAPPEPEDEDLSEDEEVEEEQLDAEQQTTTIMTETGQILHVVTSSQLRQGTNQDGEQIVYLQLDTVDGPEVQDQGHLDDQQVQVEQIEGQQVQVLVKENDASNEEEAESSKTEPLKTTEDSPVSGVVAVDTVQGEPVQGDEVGKLTIEEDATKAKESPDTQHRRSTRSSATGNEEAVSPIRQTRSQKRTTSESTPGPTPKKTRTEESVASPYPVSLIRRTRSQTHDKEEKGKGKEESLGGDNKGNKTSD